MRKSGHNDAKRRIEEFIRSYNEGESSEVKQSDSCILILQEPACRLRELRELFYNGEGGITLEKRSVHLCLQISTIFTSLKRNLGATVIVRMIRIRSDARTCIGVFFLQIGD